MTDQREQIAGRYIDIVFDGPPEAETGRFVEVEDETGASVRAGEWVELESGYWALRFRANMHTTVEIYRVRELVKEAREFSRSSSIFGKSVVRELDRAILLIRRIVDAFEAEDRSIGIDLMHELGFSPEDARAGRIEAAADEREAMLNAAEAEAQDLLRAGQGRTGREVSAGRTIRRLVAGFRRTVQGEPPDAQALLADADALMESWDRKGSWSADSPVGMVMRLARALRAATGAMSDLEHDRDHSGICKLCGNGLSGQELIDGPSRCPGKGAL